MNSTTRDIPVGASFLHYPWEYRRIGHITGMFIFSKYDDLYHYRPHKVYEPIEDEL